MRPRLIKRWPCFLQVSGADTVADAFNDAMMVTRFA